MQKFREISILVLSPIPQHWKNSIADCKTLEVLPDIWHMSVGSHRREESHIKINPKTNEGILRQDKSNDQTYSDIAKKKFCE